MTHPAPETRTQYLPYALPSIGEEEIAEVADTLRSGWVTTGPKVQRFETEFAGYVDTRNAIAVNSCTAGLHIALVALGIGPDDEVLVPSFTFCSSANVVMHVGARPVFVDIADDYNIDVQQLELKLTAKTKAIIAVHYGGQACDLEAVYGFAQKHGLSLIEDAAHAVGSTYSNQKIGSDSLSADWPLLKRITVFSFYATKNMTTGEGGMITTNDDALAKHMRALTLHGMSRDAWKRYSSTGSWFYEVNEPGFKSNMTDMQAAMGIHQLRKLDSFIEKRQQYAKRYRDAFTTVEGVKTPVVRADRNHAYHIYALQVSPEKLQIGRDEFIKELAASKIGSSVHFIPVHLQPFYASQFGYRRGDLPRTEAIYDNILSIPLYPKMTESDVEDVVNAVSSIAQKYKRA